METESEEEQRRSPAAEVLKYFGILMPLLYVAMGLGFIFNPNNIFQNIPHQYALPAGIVAILYGAFRGYQIIKNAIGR